MKALSIRQPWAWAILHSGKDIENRDWTDRNPNLRFRGDFLIHASKEPDHNISRDEVEYILRQAMSRGMRADDIPNPQDVPLGGIVGRARIVDVVRNDASPWFFGPIGLVIADAMPLPFVPLKGMLGFFEVSEKCLAPSHHRQ